MRTLLSCLVALVLSTASMVAAPPSDPTAGKEVMAAMEAWKQAF